MYGSPWRSWLTELAIIASITYAIERGHVSSELYIGVLVMLATGRGAARVATAVGLATGNSMRPPPGPGASGNEGSPSPPPAGRPQFPSLPMVIGAGAALLAALVASVHELRVHLAGAWWVPIASVGGVLVLWGLDVGVRAAAVRGFARFDRWKIGAPIVVIAALGVSEEGCTPGEVATAHDVGAGLSVVGCALEHLGEPSAQIADECSKTLHFAVTVDQVEQAHAVYAAGRVRELAVDAGRGGR